MLLSHEEPFPSQIKLFYIFRFFKLWALVFGCPYPCNSMKIIGLGAALKMGNKNVFNRSQWYGSNLYWRRWNFSPDIAQKMKFSIKDFFSKCDQIRRFLLLKKSLMENFIFCGVWIRGRFWWLTNLPIKLAECMCITTSFNIISKGKLISRSIHASSLSVKWWPHAANRTRLNGDLFNNKTSGLVLVDGPVILA